MSGRGGRAGRGGAPGRQGPARPGRHDSRGRGRAAGALAAPAPGRDSRRKAMAGPDLGTGPEPDRSFEPVLADLGTPPDAGLPPAPPAGSGCGEDAPGCGGDAPGAGGLETGRVVRLDRGYPLVAGGGGACRAEHQVSIVKSGSTVACVGDWVVLRHQPGHDKALIERILPRTAELSRWDGRQRGARQVLAANVDLVLVAQQLSDRPLDLDRIARSAVLARQGRSRVAVVLTKADRVTRRDPLLDVDAVRTLLGEDVLVCLTSMELGRGVEDVRALLAPGTVSLILGESGAGKSSLVNALLGEEVLDTALVRGKDDAGRHTTVARRMLKVPGAGVLTDAPGLRSLALLDEYDGLARVFPDIASLEQGCRFRDCKHGEEPGCAVREAVRGGSVPAARLDSYRALRAEMRSNRLRLDPSAPSSLTN